MTIEKRFRDRYKSGDTPWDAGKPDFNLIETVTENHISSCKALDVGCGTGDNCIWLAQKGFSVTGTDISGIATYFGSNRPNPPRAWKCLLRKREVK
jgi:2-polyprenyl-3-methyl-5-hydroxy-6-metoxy-1,4-benzoquinol methylase